MRNAYLSVLYRLAQADVNVLSLISDNGMIVYDKFREDFPEQYFNFGISEGHMITAAAGMASCGKIPFTYTIGSFLAYRAYEFIRLDVCLQNLNVKIVGIGAGMAYGYLGPTHHATEDIAVLRPLPNLTIFSPASPKEVEAVVEEAYRINGPVYIRLGTNQEPELYEEDFVFRMGKGSVVKEGSDMVFICTGSITYEALQAAKEIEKTGKSVKVVSMHTLKPFDKELIIELGQKYAHIFTIEEHSTIGGLGSTVAEILMEEQVRVSLCKIGLEEVFAKGYGNHGQMRMQNGLDAKGIESKVGQHLKKHIRM